MREPVGNAGGISRNNQVPDVLGDRPLDGRLVKKLFWTNVFTVIDERRTAVLKFLVDAWSEQGNWLMGE